jgi:hypothetical protein
MVYAEKCRHFNGIQHDCCDAGVSYKSVRDGSAKGPYRWPCNTVMDQGRGPAVTVCERRSLLTQDEHAQQETELRAAVDRALSAVAAGKCHVCGADAEPSTVVRRCRYAACGHRIGQVLADDGDER